MMIDNNTLDTIANDVRDKIHFLIHEGYSPLLIETWIKESMIPTGLTVSKDFRIYLTESGKEIKMRPLEKALYLFFLKHVEGCRIKELPQYEDEILQIYNHLTVFDDVLANRNRVSRLVDPLSKSFLEKCANISRAFMKEMSSMEACIYCISGRRGEPKRITLDRNLVKWESVIP